MSLGNIATPRDGVNLRMQENFAFDAALLSVVRLKRVRFDVRILTNTQDISTLIINDSGHALLTSHKVFGGTNWTRTSNLPIMSRLH